jgi:uncharacterized protein YuzE
MLRYQVEGLKDLLVSYDPGAHAAYIKVRQGRVARTREEAPGVLVDIGSAGQLLGLELLDPKEIEVKVLIRLAKEFKVPDLKRIDPRALSKVYVTA